MKSIIQNGKSVEQAIEKAWETAGEPEEFTVKILDSGEKGFMGFTKRLTIISFTYPEKAERQANDQRREFRRDRDQRRDFHQRGRENREGKESREGRENRDGKQERRTQLRERFEPRPQRHAEPRTEPRIQESRPTELQQADNEPAEWTPEFITIVETDLKEMLKLMGFTAPIANQVSGKSLTINLDEELLAEISSERTLCASFSYLILQSVKRRLRKKLRGFRLRIEPKTRPGIPTEPNSSASNELSNTEDDSQE